jgi:hypothetical protein
VFLVKWCRDTFMLRIEDDEIMDRLARTVLFEFVQSR